MKHVLYGPSGWDPDQRFENQLVVRDDEARIVTDNRFRGEHDDPETDPPIFCEPGDEIVRAYNDEENETADAAAGVVKTDS